MKTITVNGNDYTLEFTFAAAECKDLVNRMFKIMTMSYVAGVNAGDDRHYIDSFGKERALYMSNWYMEDYFGEKKLLWPCIWVAAVLVAVMLIVVVGGAI